MSLTSATADLSAASSPQIPVTARIQIVPNGLGPNGQLLATVLLTPDPGNGTPTAEHPDGLTLQDWPTRVFSVLRSNGFQIPLRVAPALQTIAGCRPHPCEIPDSQIVRVSAQARRASLLQPAVLARLSDAWRACLAGESSSDWTALADMLRSTMEGSVGGAGAIATGEIIGRPENNAFGADGQLFPLDQTVADAETVESILAVPHADLALGLETARAERFLKALNLEAAARPETARAEVSRPSQPPNAAAETAAFKELRIREYDSLFDRLSGRRAEAADLFADLKDAAVSRACQPPMSLRLQCLSPSQATDPNLCDSAVDEGRRVLTYSSHPMYVVPGADREGQYPPPPEFEGNEAIGQRFFVLQSSATLSRVFGMAIDVELDAASLPPEPFAFVACDLEVSGPAQRETNWTVTKVRQTDTSELHFWPCTEGELAAYLSDEPAPETVSQIDGLIVLSRGARGNGLQPPRFDVSCLDIRTTAQTLTDSGESGSNGPAAMRSAGFTLIDREALAEAIGKLVAHVTKGGSDRTAAAWRCSGENRDLVLDADDLTTGFRPLVALPDGDFRARWSPLMARVITYGGSATSAATNVIEPALRTLIGPPDSPERMAIEQGLVTPAARKVPVQGSGSGLRVEMVIDEALVHWNGSPMGVEVTRLVVGSTEIDSVDDILPLGRTVDLPRSGAMRAPRFRYGWPYRFALSAVFIGGHSAPMTALERVASAEPGSALAACLYPRAPSAPVSVPATPRPWVRALRHAPIAAPVVLLPEGHAMRSGGPLGPESGQKMLVRSVHAGPDGRIGTKLAARNGPSLSQRLIVPPPLGLDEVEYHGVLDTSRETVPAGGLRNLRLAALSGGALNGFPVMRNRFERGPNGRRYLRGREIDLAPRLSEANSSDDTLGDAVFKPGSAGQNSRYFIDPAAETLVIGFRRPGDSAYLGLTHVDLGHGWPDRTHVLLSCRRLTDYRDEPARLDQLLDRHGESFNRAVRFDPTRSGDIVTSQGAFAGREVGFRLAPTEAYDIDLWCAPSADRLAREFALIQALGVHLTQCQQPGGQCDAAGFEAIIRNRLGNAVDSELGARIRSAASVASNAFVATGGAVAPTMAVLREIAAAVRAHMLQQPLSMISGVTSIKAVHAANRSRRPAQLFADPRGDWLESELVDTNPLVPRVEGLLPLAAIRQDGVSTSRLKVEPSARGFVLCGQIRVDLASTEAFEVRATMVLPGTETFDQLERHRVIDSRRAGVWPAIIGRDGNAVYRTGEDLFGFRIRRDGTVILPESEVVLLRVEGLPLPSQASGNQQAGIIDLEGYFADQLPDDLQGRVTHRHDFPDGAARIMSIRVATLPRHTESMQTVDRVASMGDPWVRESVSAFLSGELVDGEPLETEDMQTLTPDPVRVVLPATKRPEKCAPGTCVPAFHWDDPEPEAFGPLLQQTLHRRAVVRLALKRPWFQSGVDERLGIVLWPPFLTARDAAPLARDRIPLRADPSTWPRYLTLPEDFQDRDLGPGGAFVTRRGGDPVRAGDPERQTFLSPADFPDLVLPEGHPSRAEIVPVTLMPLDSPGEQKAQTPPMSVLLITYAPRFDPEREEWFVDVTINPGAEPEPFVRFGLVRYQPHTVPSLRCSAPIVQWAQVLPERRIAIDTDMTRSEIRITVSGRAPWRRAEAELARRSRTVDDPLPEVTAAPKIRVTLFAEHVDSMGKVRRSIVPINDADDILLTPDPPRGDQGELVWRTRIEPARLTPIAPSATLHAMIEEFEYFVPADAPGPEEELTARASGPRLLRRIDLDPFLRRP